MAAKFTAEEVAAKVAQGADHSVRAYELVRHYHPSANRRARRLPLEQLLTEAEAQAHCSRADTHVKDVSFDAYQSVKRR